MSRNINIDIYQIAKTQVDRTAVRLWLDRIGVSPEFEIPSEEAVTDPALLIAMAAKRCYLSFEKSLNPNVSKVRTDMVEYLDNILKSGHGSVMEHSVYTFAFEGISRVFSAEMNRHRAGVGISEASMRYIRYTDIPWWIPDSLKLTTEEQAAVVKAQAISNPASYNPHVVGDVNQLLSPPELEAFKLACKKVQTLAVFDRHFGQTERNYQELQDIWASELAPTSGFHGKKQITSMMRRIIPMGVATGAVYSLNMRALRHIIALRASEAAEEEILHVFCRVAKLMIESEPMLFGDFTQDEQGYMRPKYSKV